MDEKKWDFIQERLKLAVDKSNTYYECLLNVLKDFYKIGYVDGLNHNKPMYEVDYEKFYDPNDKDCFKYIQPIWERDDIFYRR